MQREVACTVKNAADATVWYLKECGVELAKQHPLKNFDILKKAEESALLIMRVFKSAKILSLYVILRN